MSFKDLKEQLARWLERLQQYDFEVLYRKGRIHGNGTRMDYQDDNVKQMAVAPG